MRLQCGPTNRGNRLPAASARPRANVFFAEPLANVGPGGCRSDWVEVVPRLIRCVGVSGHEGTETVVLSRTAGP
jgi:hypothetical protein